jgi:hypothetical protein
MIAFLLTEGAAGNGGGQQKNSDLSKHDLNYLLQPEWKHTDSSCA